MNKLALLSIALAALALAQTPEAAKKPEFEVASVRPAKDDNSHDVTGRSGFFRTHNVTLKRLIAIAYHIDIGEDLGEVSGGPKWVYSDGFDVNAKIPDEFAHGAGARQRLGQMLQSLLADRFQLVIRREQRQVAGYALLTAAKRPKMEPAKPGEKGQSVRSHNGRLTAVNSTMQTLAGHLSAAIEKPVADHTGLTGGFNFELDWMPERLSAKPEASSDSGPSIFTALQEQLGLKLESAQVPIQVIVIDRAERPSEN